jgi:hypothetical protein
MAIYETPIASGVYIPGQVGTYTVPVTISTPSLTTPLIVSSSGSVWKTPNTSADDLIINCGANGGLSILSSTNGTINFGNGTSSTHGGIIYKHPTNVLELSTNTGANLFDFTTNGTFEMNNATDLTPTLQTYTSGAIFISGGALFYKGFSGTYTELAPA